MRRSRLDLLAVEKGLFSTRQSAQTAIMDGAVLVDGQKVTKPGMNVPETARVELVPGFSVPKYVSRGGLKLEKALIQFAVDIKDRICLDIGASTGGFTDCLLQSGAQRVYAIDVGYGQLDWSLRQDERVVTMERVNARYLEPITLYKHADERATLAVADVSFIGLAKVLPATLNLLSPGKSELILLVKPQFEVGKQLVGKGGVVRDPEAHIQVINAVIAAAAALALKTRNLTFSPITGPAGNIEYLLHLANFGDERELDINHTVSSAFAAHHT